MGNNVTYAVIFSAIAALIIYDVFALLKWGNDCTISVRIWTLARRYPIIPFAIGVLMGHFFWQMMM